MARNTRQKNSTIKELTFGANAPSTTSFVRQQFSRSVQTPLVRSGFDAVVHVSKHIPHTVSHCHRNRNRKLQTSKRVVRNFAGRIDRQIIEGIRERRWSRASNSLCTHALGVNELQL